MVLSQELAERLTRIESKSDQLLEMMADSRVVQARQQVILDEHIRRTAANEGQLEHLKETVKPLVTHVAWFGATAKVLGTVGTLLGVAAGISKLLGH